MKNWFPKSWDFHINTFLLVNKPLLVVLLSKIIIKKKIKVVGRGLRKEEKKKSINSFFALLSLLLILNVSAYFISQIKKFRFPLQNGEETELKSDLF